jgi:hypothetical protein
MNLVDSNPHFCSPTGKPGSLQTNFLLPLRLIHFFIGLKSGEGRRVINGTTIALPTKIIGFPRLPTQFSVHAFNNAVR